MWSFCLKPTPGEFRLLENRDSVKELANYRVVLPQYIKIAEEALLAHQHTVNLLSHEELCHCVALLLGL